MPTPVSSKYLALDYTRHILPEGIRAWRLVDGL